MSIELNMVLVDGDDARILVLANCFRAAIEACDPRKLPIGFHEFPRGSCGDATLVLAQYLRENGQEGFTYVSGTRDGYSHGWLQRNGLIVDITGDQFADNEDPVRVSRRSAWHAQFEIDRECSSDIDMMKSRDRAWAPHTTGYRGTCLSSPTRHL